ncbi:MAG TPA: hypothetical protein VGK04_03010 [Thermoanaerobaculia bacterium]|jgi:hypothetical protein
MRAATLAFCFLSAISASAANIWFDPPNPTSRTSVVAHVLGAYCARGPMGSTVTRTGNLISISLKFDCTVGVPILAGFDEIVDLGVLPAGVYEVVAGPNELLIAIAEGKLTVRDVSSPLQISPEQGNYGDILTIRGAGIAPVCAVAPCPVPRVFVGDREAVVLRTPDTDTIVASLVSARRSGVVDVTVQSAGRTFQSIAGFYYSPVVLDDSQSSFREPIDPAFFEPMLIPVAINGAGALGSRWTTEVTLRNENDFPFAAYTIFDNSCMPVCDIRMHPHTSRLIRPNQPNGYLFYVSRQGAPNAFFGILLRDLSHQSEALGTEMRVVREKDFFDRPFTIVNVPSDMRFRVALRLYRIDGGTTLSLRIRTLDAIEGYGPSAEQPPLVDAPITLALRGDRLASAYIGDLLTAYPQLAGKGALRVEISGTPSQRAAWAFVSVTNNETQHVTIISPQ